MNQDSIIAKLHDEIKQLKRGLGEKNRRIGLVSSEELQRQLSDKVLSFPEEIIPIMFIFCFLFLGYDHRWQES